MFLLRFGTKKTIRLAIVRASFCSLWGERHKRLFNDYFSSFARFMEFVLSNAKTKHSSPHFSLSFLVSNWLSLQ